MSTITFYVRGTPRLCSREKEWDRLIGPKPPEDFECDGCSLSPDYIADRAIWPACIIHDYHYRASGLGVSRWGADWIFLRNVYRLLRLGRLNFGVAIYVSLIYWWAVRTKGGGAYTGGRNPK